MQKSGVLTKTFLVLSENCRQPLLYEESDFTPELEIGFSRRFVLAELCDLKHTPYLTNYVFHQRFVNTPIFGKILLLKFEKFEYFW